MSVGSVVAAVPTTLIFPLVGTSLWWFAISMAAHYLVFMGAHRYAARAPATYLQDELPDDERS